jgi:hypothetical protein
MVVMLEVMLIALIIQLTTANKNSCCLPNYCVHVVYWKFHKKKSESSFRTCLAVFEQAATSARNRGIRFKHFVCECSDTLFCINFFRKLLLS